MQSRASDRERSRVADLSSSSFVRVPFIRASLMLLAVVGVTLLFTGCGPRRVKADFTHYENSYAVTSNREELLNLARLDQHDPTYFFKLGQISSSYRMEAALTGTGQVSTVANPPASVIPTGGGSPTFLYENDPSFTLIPVNDDTNANILLRPISAEVFYSLYLQGWRLDQLFRLTVNRIELTLPVPDPTNPKKTRCEVEVIRNIPPPDFDAKTNYANDGYTLASYITFLRVSAVIYALQKHGLLLLRGTSTFEPLDRASYIPNDTGSGQQSGAGKSKAGSNGNPSPDASPSAPKSSSLPAAKDFNDAAAKGDVWELQGADTKGQGGAWYLGANAIQPQFQLTSRSDQPDATSGSAPANTNPGYVPEPGKFGDNVQAIEDVLVKDFQQSDNGMTELLGATHGEGADLKEILEMLYNGFSIEESSTDQASENSLCSGSQANRISAHLVMRSLMGLMAAAAQEQKSFDALEKAEFTDTQFIPGGPPCTAGQNSYDPGKLQCELAKFITDTFVGAHLATTGKPPDTDEQAYEASLVDKTPTFRTLVPQIEQLPVMKLTWTKGKSPDDLEELHRLGFAVSYRGQDYYVADPKSDSALDSPYPFVSHNTYWNRDMFRLINELSSQVSVDISKFPLPEVLQLRTE